MVSPEEAAQGKGPKKLTAEELEERVRKAREKRAEEEQRMERNREKMRIRMGKELQVKKSYISDKIR